MPDYPQFGEVFPGTPSAPGVVKLGYDMGGGVIYDGPDDFRSEDGSITGTSAQEILDKIADKRSFDVVTVKQMQVGAMPFAVIMDQTITPDKKYLLINGYGFVPMPPAFLFWVNQAAKDKFIPKRYDPATMTLHLPLK